MILVDTPVWIDHLRTGDEKLASLLNSNRVVMHPFVIGELACGNLQNRKSLLHLLQNLPKTPVATQDETLFFIERQALMGRGIGFIDAHVLAATALDEGTRLWTRDKRLHTVARELNLAWLTA